jgi:hypothetical protein
MTHVGSNHAHDNSKPNSSLCAQAEHNAFVDSEQNVKATNVSQHHLQNGSDGNGCSRESWDWNRAAEEAFRIEEAEIGSAESRKRLEVEEVVAVDDGDARRGAELGRHGGLFRVLGLLEGVLKLWMIEVLVQLACLTLKLELWSRESQYQSRGPRLVTP